MSPFGHAARRLAGSASILALLLAITAVVAGMLLPPGHVVTRSLTLSRTPEAVWRAITDSVLVRSWRSDLARLERLPDSAGHARWREHGTDGSDRVVTILDEVPPVHRVVVRDDGDAGVQLRWDMVIERDPSGVRLRVTEHGTISRRWQRFVSQFTSAHAGLLERWMRQLARHFDEPPRIRQVGRGGAGAVAPVRWHRHPEPA